MRFIDRLILAGVFLILTVAMVMGFAGVNAEKRCLEAGYPNYKVTWSLDTYCISLDGATYTQVRELE